MRQLAAARRSHAPFHAIQRHSMPRTANWASIVERAKSEQATVRKRKQRSDNSSNISSDRLKWVRGGQGEEKDKQDAIETTKCILPGGGIERWVAELTRI